MTLRFSFARSRRMVFLFCLFGFGAQAQAQDALPDTQASDPAPSLAMPADAKAKASAEDRSVKGLMGNDASTNNGFFREVAKDLRCPTCTGLSVLESDASFSVQIKDQVQEQIKLGKSKDDILRYFVERYGPWILREPPKEGFNLLAWLIPISILVCGPILIWFFIWRRREHVNIHGVRSTELVLEEMKEQLSILRGAGK